MLLSGEHRVRCLVPVSVATSLSPVKTHDPRFGAGVSQVLSGGMKGAWAVQGPCALPVGNSGKRAFTAAWTSDTAAASLHRVGTGPCKA